VQRSGSCVKCVACSWFMADAGEWSVSGMHVYNAACFARNCQRSY
jgi:hypothetical protein